MPSKNFALYLHERDGYKKTKRTFVIESNQLKPLVMRVDKIYSRRWKTRFPWEYAHILGKKGRYDNETILFIKFKD